MSMNDCMIELNTYKAVCGIGAILEQALIHVLPGPSTRRLRWRLPRVVPELFRRNDSGLRALQGCVVWGIAYCTVS